MKISIIISSPKGKSSFTLRMAKILSKELGDVFPNVIDLFEKNILFCSGCMSCVSTGHCFINDDLNNVVSELGLSDMLIFATPVYIFNVNPKMKNFMDRTIIWAYKNSILRGKITAAVCTADGYGAKNCINILKKYFTFAGFLFSGSLYCYIYEFKTYKEKNSRFNKDIKKIKSNYDQIINGSYKLSLTDYIYFNIKKQMLILGQKRYPKEHQFWKENGLFKKDFYDIGIKLKKNILFRILGKIISIFSFDKHK